jgi:hypothetical protein
MRNYRVIGLGLAGAAVAVGAVLLMPRTTDARLAACGATATNLVETTFDIPAANRIWEFVPGLQETPELENDSRPAFVVLFAGEFTTPFGGQPVQGEAERGPKTYRDVTCIVQADGTINVYADVPREGLVLP